MVHSESSFEFKSRLNCLPVLLKLAEHERYKSQKKGCRASGRKYETRVLSTTVL